MNVPHLVDAIVRQTTVLIAQLATAGGARAHLAHTANQVFLDLVQELKAQGLGHTVIADMFGLALRTYHGKVRRLSESTTVRGESLWSAVLGYVQAQQPIARGVLLTRFASDDSVAVNGVLADLVDSGLVSRTGRGDQVVYRAVDLEEGAASGTQGSEELEQFVWVAVHRFGPIGVDELAVRLSTPASAIEPSLAILVNKSLVRREQVGVVVTYRADHCLIPVGASVGWEAAVFDHYQAVVTAICTKIGLGQSSARVGEWVGGSTYHYDVWDEHPLLEEVGNHLTQLRQLSVALRERVEAYNRDHQPPNVEGVRRFTAYVGQTVQQDEGSSS